MSTHPSPGAIAALRADMNTLIDRLQTSPNGDLLLQSLSALTEISKTDTDRLDLKILSSALKDMERAFKVLNPHRHTRKISIFGSARTPESAPEYQMAKDFAALDKMYAELEISVLGLKIPLDSIFSCPLSREPMTTLKGSISW